MGLWREGYAIDHRVGWGPVFAVPIGVAAVVINSVRDDGDIRAGVLPWAMTLVVASFAGCALAALSLHRPNPSRWMIVGGWWSTIACACIATFFVGVAVGSALGLEEEDLGPAVIPLVMLMAFGLLSMTPALGLLAVGLAKARRVPRFARLAVAIMSPALPALLILGGLFEGAVETIGSAVLVAAFGIGWVLLGIAVAADSAGEPAISGPPAR